MATVESVQRAPILAIGAAIQSLTTPGVFEETMLIEISGNLPCYSDTLRATGDGWRSDLVMLSMFGPRNAVRAAWANLSKSSGRRGRCGSITVGGRNVGMSEGISYLTVSAPLDRGLLHSVIFHPMLGHNAPDIGFIYQTGPDADRRYFARLARWCPVPLRITWCSLLWDLGRKHGSIVAMEGHGREVWRVSTSRDAWEPIVRDALVAGELR